MSDPDQAIIDQSDLRKYRTELPNLYDDSDLDVYEFRLLAHYKRVGTCTEGLETTARKCKMSEGKASEVRQALAEKGFISLKRVSMDAGRYRFIVTVSDRWIENFARYSGFTVEEIAAQLKRVSPSRGEASPSHSEASPSRGEGKKELIKKEPIKKLTTTAGAGKVFVAYENEIGAITAMTADALKDAEQIYSADWVVDAISEAALNNKRNWRYCEAILKRWKVEGRQARRQPKTDARTKSNPAASINQDIIRKVAQNAKTR